MTMHKTFAALAAAAALLGGHAAHAQVGKAASEAADATEHKIDQKRAENDAKHSGPVGKAVNNAKAGYHKNRAEHSKEKGEGIAEEVHRLTAAVVHRIPGPASRGPFHGRHGWPRQR